MNTITRLTQESQKFIDWAHWSYIQSEGRPADDGRLASLGAYLNVNTKGSYHVYYRDNGQIIVGSTNAGTVEAARAFTAGWSHSLLQLELNEGV